MLVQTRLRGHIAQCDAGRLDDINRALVGTIQQVDERFDFPAVDLGHLGIFPALGGTHGVFHEVGVGAQIGQGNHRVLYRVIIIHMRVYLDSPEHIGRDLTLNQSVYVVAVVTQICKVPAALPVILDVFLVSKHGHHEFDGFRCCDSGVAVQHLGHVCE